MHVVGAIKAGPHFEIGAFVSVKGTSKLNTVKSAFLIIVSSSIPINSLLSPFINNS